jgi:hypothetical protein
MNRALVTVYILREKEKVMMFMRSTNPLSGIVIPSYSTMKGAGIASELLFNVSIYPSVLHLSKRNESIT